MIPYVKVRNAQHRVEDRLLRGEGNRQSAQEIEANCRNIIGMRPTITPDD
jgi:hypothetical protein